MATIRMIYVEKVPPVRLTAECDPIAVEKVRDELARSAKRIARTVLANQESDDEPRPLKAVKGGQP